jgi:acyl-CoA synthetase (AMP-forming)/AMP-acid ligase II
MMASIQTLAEHLQSHLPRLAEILRFWATTTPERPYFFSNHQWYSYAALYQQALALAQILRKQLPGAGAIALSIHHFEPLVPLLWAALIEGRTLAFLPQNQDTDLTRTLMDQVGASYLISDQVALYKFPQAVSISDLLNIQRSEQPSEPAPVTPTQRATATFILHTSGTTGDVKWVKLSELQFLHAIQSLAQVGGLDHAHYQCVYLTPPLTHSYGLSRFLEYTYVGSAIAVAPTIQPLSILGGLTHKALSAEITALEGVPDFYRFLSRSSRKIILPNLQHIGFGGGAADLEAIAWLVESSPTLTGSIRYGLTETPSVVSHTTFSWSGQCPSGITLAADHRSSGKILPIYNVCIVDESGQPTPQGQEGEILIQGDCLGLPYLGETAVLNTPFATGDLGYFNAKNELVITGRKSIFIKHKGFRISPEMIEAAIRSIPAVLDCRVSLQNDELVAEIVGQEPEIPTQQIFEFITPKLPSYALPTSITWVPQLPRTPSGKLKRI